MEGVEILATGTLPIEEGFGWGMAILSFAVAFLISFFYLGISFENFGAGLGGGILVGCFFAVIAGFANPPVVGQISTYKVIISDEVSMNEFTNRYEILEQEGKIYTVKEIMPDAN